MGVNPQTQILLVLRSYIDSGDARGIADIAHQFYAEIRADERKRVLEEVEKELTGMKFLFDEGYYYDCDEVRELLAKMRKA